MPETPMRDWPEAQRAMHEEFSTWVVETSQAKVWVVCDAANRDRLAKHFIVPTSVQHLGGNRILYHMEGWHAS